MCGLKDDDDAMQSVCSESVVNYSPGWLRAQGSRFNCSRLPSSRISSCLPSDAMPVTVRVVGIATIVQSIGIMAWQPGSLAGPVATTHRPPPTASYPPDSDKG